MRIVVDGLPYPIAVSHDGGEAARFAQNRRTFVVFDAAVARRSAIVVEALRGGGSTVTGEHGMAAGERHKRWPSVSAIHDALLAAGAGREVVVVAVGGGTLTDVAGFAAATYMRGVDWLPVATSLVGMVDAAIGGKTAVNTAQGKNLIGAFWDPIAVVADLGALETLPFKARQEGAAEMVKAAVVGGPALLDALEREALDAPPERLAALIAAAASVKARAVVHDPRDAGSRAALNLGHTFGHAIEHASRYRIGHGAAVALGLRAAGIAARDRTGYTLAEHQRVMQALKHCGLRVRLRGLDPHAVANAMRFDKKRDGEVGRFVLPVRIGEVRTDIVLPEAEAIRVLEELGQPMGRRTW